MATATPGDAPGQFVNELDPVLELYGPDGQLLASDADGAPDGRNATLWHITAEAGVYTVCVRPEGAPAAGLLGEYYAVDWDIQTFPDDFEALAPTHTRVDPVVDFPSTSYSFAGYDDLRDYLAARWTGKVLIDTPGDVTFTLTSDDASLRGTVVCPRDVTFQSTGNRPVANFLSAETASERFEVIMTLQRGEPPKVGATDKGLSANVTVGKRAVLLRNHQIVFMQ